MWNLSQFDQRTAIISEDGVFATYQQVAEKAKKLADYVETRHLVLCLCSNTLGFLVGYVGFINKRVVPLMLKGDLDLLFINRYIDTYKPTYLYVPEHRRADLMSYDSIYSDNGYHLLKSSSLHEFSLYSDLALLLCTSGSTGSPKLVRQSYKNIKSNMEAIAECLSLDEKERAITTLPMNYTYGLSIIHSHLFVGASLILTDKALMQKEFWYQLNEYKATSFGGVPYTYEMLDRLRFYRRELPTFRTMTQAGGRLSEALHLKYAQYALDTNRSFVVMYGQTEATARMSYLPSHRSLEKIGSIGVPIPGGTFSLLNEDGEPIESSDIVGELVYNGANVALGYAECGDDLAKGDEWGGSLKTGDMARRDADGFYYIAGRKGRFLKIYGIRINLDETERMIREKFQGIDCVCAGQDDLMSIYITDANIKQEVLAFVSKMTRFNQAAFSLHCIDAIPRNEFGKILYKNL